MMGRTMIGISAVVSLLLAGTYFYFQWKNSPPTAGAGWEIVEDFGKIKMVSVVEEKLYEPEFMAAILDTIIGPAYEKRQGFFTLYFFDDPEFVPRRYAILNEFNRGEKYPFSPDQLRHLRATYTFTMPMESEFCYITLSEHPGGSHIQTHAVQIHPGKVGEQDFPDLSHWKQGRFF